MAEALDNFDCRAELVRDVDVGRRLPLKLFRKYRLRAGQTWALYNIGTDS
jgi:hypothetical protein